MTPGNMVQMVRAAPVLQWRKRKTSESVERQFTMGKTPPPQGGESRENKQQW